MTQAMTVSKLWELWESKVSPEGDWNAALLEVYRLGFLDGAATVGDIVDCDEENDMTNFVSDMCDIEAEAASAIQELKTTGRIVPPVRKGEEG